MKRIITASMEDYLKTIYIVQKRSKVVRVKDIASLLEVKAPSVIDAISLLKKNDLVLQEPYGYIELTKKGRAIAKKIYDHHRILTNFFKSVLKIEPKTAEKEACKIEHCLSEQTIDVIAGYVDNGIELEPGLGIQNKKEVLISKPYAVKADIEADIEAVSVVVEEVAVMKSEPELTPESALELEPVLHSESVIQEPVINTQEIIEKPVKKEALPQQGFQEEITYQTLF
jgi:Mn-dependent DtxR family transcriptional regulator